MSKCVCHINGYEVKDAVARRKIEELVISITNNTLEDKKAKQAIKELESKIDNLDMKDGVARQVIEDLKNQLNGLSGNGLYLKRDLTQAFYDPKIRIYQHTGEEGTYVQNELYLVNGDVIKDNDNLSTIFVNGTVSADEILTKIVEIFNGNLESTIKQDTLDSTTGLTLTSQRINLLQMVTENDIQQFIYAAKDTYTLDNQQYVFYKLGKYCEIDTTPEGNNTQGDSTLFYSKSSEITAEAFFDIIFSKLTPEKQEQMNNMFTSGTITREQYILLFGLANGFTASSFVLNKNINGYEYTNPNTSTLLHGRGLFNLAFYKGLNIVALSELGSASGDNSSGDSSSAGGDGCVIDISKPGLFFGAPGPTGTAPMALPFVNQPCMYMAFIGESAMKSTSGMYIPGGEIFSNGSTGEFTDTADSNRGLEIAIHSDGTFNAYWNGQKHDNGQVTFIITQKIYMAG